jgi:hypothetical protein
MPQKVSPFSSLVLLGLFGAVVAIAGVIAAWWYIFHAAK